MSFKRLALSGAFCLATWLVPTEGFAQSTIAGVVVDDSGAVLPGVTVEVASPALIEKTRAVVTDGQGRYSVADVRPRRIQRHVQLARLQHCQAARGCRRVRRDRAHQR